MTWGELGVEAIACTVVIAGFILLCIAVYHGERAARWLGGLDRGEEIKRRDMVRGRGMAKGG